MTVGIQQLIWEIERIRDAFHAAIHSASACDPALQPDFDTAIDTAIELVTDDCVLANLPMATGSGGSDLRRHVAEDIVPHLPADLTFRRVSRTTDKSRVVDESVVGFTHDRELPWLLPGAAPTGRRAEVLAISVVTFRHSRINAHRTRSLIASHRTLWDHTGLLAQLGLTRAAVPAGRGTAADL